MLYFVQNPVYVIYYKVAITSSYVYIYRKDRLRTGNKETKYKMRFGT